MDTKPVVLIVDDEPINIQTLVNCLKDHYEIKVATNEMINMDVRQGMLDIQAGDMRQSTKLNQYKLCQTELAS